MFLLELGLPFEMLRKMLALWPTGNSGGDTVTTGVIWLPDCASAAVIGNKVNVRPSSSLDKVVNTIFLMSLSLFQRVTRGVTIPLSRLSPHPVAYWLLPAADEGVKLPTSSSSPAILQPAISRWFS